MHDSSMSNGLPQLGCRYGSMLFCLLAQLALSSAQAASLTLQKGSPNSTLDHAPQFLASYHSGPASGN